MNGTELLNIINKSTLKHDSQKQELYEKYFPIIDAILVGVQDDMDFSNLSSLKGIAEQTDFENFIRNSDYETIKLKFENIITDLKTTIRLTALGANWLKVQQQNNHKFSIIFIVILGVLSLAVFIFSILENFKIIDTADIATGVCGSIDFAFGVAFFIYEWISDRRTKNMKEDMAKVQSGGIIIQNRHIKNKGCGAIFGVQIGTNQKIDTQSEAQIKAFIEKYIRE